MEKPDTKRINPVDLSVGLIAMVACAAVAWVSIRYGLGTPRRMGAGAFPFVSALIGLCYGAVIAVRALKTHERFDLPVQWRRLFFVCAAFLLLPSQSNPSDCC